MTFAGLRKSVIYINGTDVVVYDRYEKCFKIVGSATSFGLSMIYLSKF